MTAVAIALKRSVTPPVLSPFFMPFLAKYGHFCHSNADILYMWWDAMNSNELKEALFSDFFHVVGFELK